MLWALWGRKNELGPLTAASEIYQAVLELGWILVLFTLVWTNREPYSTLGFRRVRWQPELIWAALILGAQWAVAWALVALAASLDWMPGPSDHPRDDGTLLFRLVAPFSLAVGALFEEAFFRGYLWRRIEMLTGRPAAALLITSTLFAAYHPYSWWATAQVFVFGLIMGAFYWKGRSVPRLALAHALFNVLIVYA
jgi:membrane protease YdiL (CAAX protease family)